MAVAITTASLLQKRKLVARSKVLTLFEFLESEVRVEELKFSLYKRQIDDYLNSVNLLEEQIVNAYLAEEVDEVTVESFNKDCTLFRIQVIERLFSLQPSKVTDSKERQESSVKSRIPSVVPRIECPKFNERDLEIDKLAFLNFSREFQNCVVNLDCDALRLVVLRNHLTGYAFQLIRHLTVSDENYRVALGILTTEFLDENHIVDSIFSSILLTDKITNNAAVRKFLSSLKAQVYELKNSFGLDFVETNSPGNKLLSHIVFGKLPALFRSELIHKGGNNFPSLEEILDNCAEITRTIEFCKPDSFPRKVERPTKRKFSSKLKYSAETKKPSTLENFYTNASKANYSCNFCRTNNHKGHTCKSYPTYADRLKRCKELGLCTKCSSSLHEEKNCCCNKKEFGTCWSCNKEGHHRNLCPHSVGPQTMSNACWLTNSSSILPVIKISVDVGCNKSVAFNCLLDTGSERSYLSRSLLDKFSGLAFPSRDRKFLIKTFLGKEMKNLKEIDLNVKFFEGLRSVSFLFDGNLDLSFRINGLNSLIEDLKRHKVKLATDFSELRNDTLPVYGLLGVDVIKFLGPMNLNKFREGHVWEFPQGMVLFGNIADFRSLRTEELSLNYAQIVEEYSSCNITRVYFVLDSKSEYVDPWNGFEESSVDRTVYKLYSLETMGIVENEFSDYDKKKIEAFRSSISFVDNCYHISLPWNEEKLSNAPSNYQVSLSVLDRVSQKLSKKDLYHDYCQVFLEQEKEGIIERINVDPSNFSKYTWIPHRPVLKQDLQCTTKIRPVFNCSLRTGGKPSLNDCAYAGVNLYSDMLELILKFRTNRYVFLADIRKAFLMIKLRNESDKNRFCFFLKLEDKLVCFRYKTLIFGFVSGPFILSYIVKFHVQKYPPGPCRDLLLDSFYVDNLVKTHQSASVLLQLYTDAVAVIQEGGFSLKTCSSNSELVAQ